MKTNRTIAGWLMLLALSTLNSQLSTAYAQGSLTPPGPPAPTMKTADQIEPRTPISSTPYFIYAPGSYYLTRNLTNSFDNVISIYVSGVTLDLNGFTLSSTAASPALDGIMLSSGLSDITVVNGHICSGVTNNGSGVYSGSGFAYGIYYFDPAPVNVVISKVSVSGVLYDGINLGKGNATVVEDCTVTTAGGNGIVASTIKGSAATGCGNNAITATIVSDCCGYCTGGGYGLFVYQTANNCYGYSISGFGIFVYESAINCCGVCSSNSTSGWGLCADASATGCSGWNYGSGNGLYSNSAENCQGSSVGGTGLAANNAINCTAQAGSGGGRGLSASVAIGCYGYSYSGTGLNATIANSCMGLGNPNYTVTYKYNMP